MLIHWALGPLLFKSLFRCNDITNRAWKKSSKTFVVGVWAVWHLDFGLGSFSSDFGKQVRTYN